MYYLYLVIGGIRHDQKVNKVSVIGGGDLGMTAVLSILAKASSSHYTPCKSWYLFYATFACTVSDWCFCFFIVYHFRVVWTK